MKTVSIVTPCFNEEGTIGIIYEQIKNIMDSLPGYNYEHIFIDNCSEDKTVDELTKLARHDSKVKLILNTRNFGQIRSSNHALLQATGDAVIHLVADLQDPPELVPKFIKKWAEGYPIVIGQKKTTKDSWGMSVIRRLYYWLIDSIATSEQIKNYTGFGLYDKKVIDTIRSLKDPYPYFRGLISELGFEVAKVQYDQPARLTGLTSHSFYSLYDMAVLGITNHSKVPLRVATFLGFMMSILSLGAGFFYLAYKLLYWSEFELGAAPLIIGLFFFAAVQLFFIGIIGEYIGSIHTQVLKRPMVVEKERVNF